MLLLDFGCSVNSLIWMIEVRISDSLLYTSNFFEGVGNLLWGRKIQVFHHPLIYVCNPVRCKNKNICRECSGIELSVNSLRSLLQVLEKVIQLLKILYVHIYT